MGYAPSIDAAFLRKDMGITSEKGTYGENIAVRYLESKGYRILERNYRCIYGELDIIAELDGLAIIVEVKLRKNDSFLPAYAAVGAKKQERIKKSTLMWLSEQSRDYPIRFDVIEIYTGAAKQTPFGEAYTEPTVNHIKNAFF